MAETNKNESFVRWQGITITQFGYTANLLLGLAVAALGFLVNLLLNKDFDPISWQKCAFSIALMGLLASVWLGIWCNINRLRDFRVTTEIARKREQNDPDSQLDPLRDLSDRLGKKTWWLFWWQIGTFGVSILFAVVGITNILGAKLV